LLFLVAHPHPILYSVETYSEEKRMANVRKLVDPLSPSPAAELGALVEAIVPAVVTASEPEPKETPKAPQRPSEGALTVHVLEDGFTALGRVWSKDEEITVARGSREYRLTLDNAGVSYLDWDEAKQKQNYKGKVKFRQGPLPEAKPAKPAHASIRI
jgi:hypothetical protein